MRESFFQSIVDGRGRVVIGNLSERLVTTADQRVIRNNADYIRFKYLNTYPYFADFHEKKRKKDGNIHTSQHTYIHAGVRALTHVSIHIAEYTLIHC